MPVTIKSAAIEEIVVTCHENYNDWLRVINSEDDGAVAFSMIIGSKNSAAQMACAVSKRDARILVNALQTIIDNQT